MSMAETLLPILWSLARVGAGVAIVWLVVPLISRWLGRLTARTKSDTDDILVRQVVKTIRPLGILAAV